MCAFVYKNKITLLCIGFFLLLSIPLAKAQIPDSSAVVITLSPLSPGPNEDVTAELRLFSENTNTAFITWTRNGSVSLSGMGAKTFRFRSGNVGKKETITATARTTNGKTFSASAEFLIGDIDLLWRAYTTIPPEYRGRALVSPFSSIIITAIPHFSSANITSSANDIEFEWSINGSKQGTASGLGKDTLTFSVGAATGGHQITLKATNKAKNISLEKSISIPVYAPEVLLYKEQPLEGPFFGQALSQITLTGGEITAFRAIPYFFPITDAPFLSYIWRENNTERTPSPPYIYQFPFEGGIRSGNITLEATIQNKKHTIQKASAKINIYAR